MKKLVIDPNNPASTVAFIREILTDTQSAYLGIMDKLPEAFQAQVKALKEKIDTALTSLASKPTEQVPAALDASAALNHMAYTLNYMNEMFSGTMEALNKMLADYTPKVTALQSLQGRIEKKELLEATEVETRVNQAKDEAVKSERERQKLLNTRRTVLAKADVPLPLEDTPLDGDDKAFEATKTKASDRAKKLTALGLMSAMNSEDISRLVWGDDTIFNTAVAVAERTPGKPQAEPLAGGRPADGKVRRLAIA